MKSIEERAKEYAAKCPGCQNTEWGFIAGAQSEREEMLRWRDAEKELPEDGATVLGKTSCVQHPFVIMRYIDRKWWVWAYPGWAAPAGEVIGWRPIYEIEQMP